MAIIRLNRIKEFNNGGRNFRIYIDGEKVGSVANGETKDFETTAGQHTIIAKIDWCSSPTITVNVQENQPKEMTVKGFKNGKRIAIIGAGIFVLYLVLSTFLNFNYLSFIAIPIFLFLFYYITIGRKKYLMLYEEKREAQ